MDELQQEKFQHIEEKIDNLKDAVKHATVVIEEVRDMETASAGKIEVVKQAIKDHHDLLWNKGKDGLVMRVDRLEQANKNARFTWERIMLIASTATTIFLVIKEYVTK